nr:retrovirus-related Pol polyprotein from transposon TNT 1-94 [Tanacetum cinerariifolium]
MCTPWMARLNRVWHKRTLLKQACMNWKKERVSFGRGQHTTEGVIDYVHADLWSPSQEFNNLCKERGIARHLTVSGTPQQNGLAERMNSMLLNKVRCLLIQSGFLDSFWAEVMVMAAYLINRSPSTTLEKKTPMDLWLRHPVNYEMLRIFGYVAYSYVNQGKLKPRAIKCIFLGYPDGVKGYRLWRLDDVKPKIIISRDVVFNESLMYKDTLKGVGDVDSRKEVEFEVELQGRTMKGNYLYSLDGWAESGEASVGIQDNESLAQVWHKRTLVKQACMNWKKKRSPSTTLEKKTPMDLWSRHPVNYEMLRIFGCVAYSYVNRGKLKPRAIKCIFLGYPDGVKGYRLWRLDDVKPKIIISRDVVFNESLMYKDTLKSVGAVDSRKEVEFKVELQGDNYVLVRHRAKRTTFIPARYRDEEEDTHKPITFQEAMNSSDKDEWVHAMEEKMSSLMKNHTWELVDQPPGQKLRARIDYNEVFSPVVRHTSIRVILALTICKDYELEQLDVKTAFLHAAAAMIVAFTSKSLHQANILMYQRHLAQIKKYQAQQNKPATKTERRNFYMLIPRSNAGWKVKDFKGMTFEQIKEKFIPVWEKIQDFVPMNYKLESERRKRPRIQL